MKKIVMIFAAMAAVLSSCTKNEMDPVTGDEDKDIVLNISVSDPGADTKALIKTGWEANDQIKIWFDARTGDSPDLVIKYDKTNDKWTQDGDAAFVPTSASGNVKAVYSNNVIVASVDEYTLSGNTLTFSIAHWVFLTEVQVVVYSDDIVGTKPDKYTLFCDKFTPCTGYSVEVDGIISTKGTIGTAVTGIKNDGANGKPGVAFVFATADYSTSSTDKQDFVFVLKDNTSGSEVTKVYKPNVAIAAKEGKSSIKALTIANTKFIDFVIPEFVDLGLTNGLKWRSWNLGASKPEEYGSYFAWGATELAYESLISNTFKFVGSRPNSYGGSGWDKSKGFNNVNAPYRSGSKYVKYTTGASGDNKVKLESGDDAAYQANNSWHMPTTEDFKELAKECFAEWIEDYNNTGVKGVIFWKAKSGDAGWYKPVEAGKGLQIKDDGSEYNDAVDHTFSNKYNIYMDSYVFFPVAGYGNSTSSNAGSGGYYWSSTLSATNFAYHLYFYSSNVYPQYNTARHYGYSVRPVSD